MKKQWNKNAPNPFQERASVPETKTDSAKTKETNGNVTVEAAFAIPVFLLAVLCLIWVMEIQSIRIYVLHAAQIAAKEAAEDTAVVPVLNTVKLKNDIVKLIGEERIDRSILNGGEKALSCWKSYMLPGTGEIKIRVEYEVQLPVPLFGNPSARLCETFLINGWRGYGRTDLNSEDSELVYITENGMVYHEDYQCSYLHLSIRHIPWEQAELLRNLDGERYRPCESCWKGETMAGIYITESGNKYHSSLNCNGLKRTIRTVTKAEAGGRRACSRCSQ